MAQNSEFIAWLKGEHAQIMDFERQALVKLADGDKDGYENGMRARARRLADLAAGARKHLQGLPADQADKAQAALSKFSASADMALNIGSIFFMSALLYRDDHKKGEPDNLEVLIRDLCGASGPCVRHIVWWRLKPEADGRTAAQNAERIAAGWGALKDIAGVLSVELSCRILSSSTVPAQVILTSTHVDAAALQAYAVDPVHLKFAELINACCEGREAIDFEI